MSNEKVYSSEEERWEALHGVGVETAAPEGFERAEGEDGGFEDESDGVWHPVQAARIRLRDVRSNACRNPYCGAPLGRA